MKPFFFSAISFFFIFCSQGISFTENLNRDYYFYKNSVQIQGKSLLPEAKSQDGSYKPIYERREICFKNAVLVSHSKWLSLTVKEKEDPAVWLERLQMGAAGAWSSCLKKARHLNTFYDDQQSCRIVMLYTCKPQNY
ncbi:MAG: hypothetical protein OEZ34_14640 [Spirochaetia bacterium]|nr:hypothetical protein [Spirochaetia bacterium]